MAQFLELNLPDYIIHQDDRSTTSSENLCFCCLAQNKTMINLANCEHNGFLEYFTMREPKLLVCDMCHNMLVKICIFKKQVAESSRIMNLKLQVIQKTNKLYNLQKTEITLTSNETEIEEIQIKDELEHADAEFNFKDDLESSNQNLPFEVVEPELSNQNHPVELTTEIQIKQEDSDFENNMPLARIVKQKKQRKKVPRKVPSAEKKYVGKIGYLVMSKEELMEERERESQKDSYLRLPFKCMSCIKGFDHEVTLKNHKKKLHVMKNGKYLCDICKSALGSVHSYKEHTKRHFRRFICIACGKCSIDIYSITQHYNQHHGATCGIISMQFNCDKCDFTTDSHRAHRYHREKHIKTQCNICGNTFANNNSLKVHMNSIHKETMHQYTCSACDKSYKSKSGLFNHTEAVHDGAQGAYCQQCRTHYATRNNLAHHLKTHSAHVTDSNKKFSCQECDAKFLTKAARENHVDWEHRKSVKHKCDKCPKVFKTAVTLKKHGKFVHEKERPPRDKICDYCGRAFTLTRILKTHIRTHTGERPLKCPHCAATFAHAAALYTHKKLLHNNKP